MLKLLECYGVHCRCHLQGKRGITVILNICVSATSINRPETMHHLNIAYSKKVERILHIALMLSKLPTQFTYSTMNLEQYVFLFAISTGIEINL
jgi:hypothetical protein